MSHEDEERPTEYDEYLFINCAAPNSVNMGMARDDKRVDHMLRLRDAGETPSVCSTASVMVAHPQKHSSSSRYQADLDPVHEEEEAAPQRSSSKRYSDSPPPPPAPSKRYSSYEQEAQDEVVEEPPRRPKQDVDDDYGEYQYQPPRPPKSNMSTAIFMENAVPKMSTIPYKPPNLPIGVDDDDDEPPYTTPFKPYRSPETPYERTLRELMEPNDGAPPKSKSPSVHSRTHQQPPPSPIPKRASSVASAVESSVSHPNHHSTTHRRDRDRDRRSRHSRHSNGGGSYYRHRRSSNDSRLAEIERENKMELLIELEKLQAMGVMLSFPLSMDNPEWKLRHELERHLAHQTLVQRITLVKGIMKLGSMVIRWLFSSFLRLDGWDKFIGDELDSGKYDASLEQVYRSIWRKGTPNPWVSLGLLVFGSAIAFHVGSVMSNGQAATSGPSGPGGMIGTILSSLFGNSGSGGGGGGGGLNPLNLVSSVLRNAGSAPAPARATTAPPPPPPMRAPSPPPSRPDAVPATPRVRARITPPTL